jgi:hypothetical protein
MMLGVLANYLFIRGAICFLRAVPIISAALIVFFWIAGPPTTIYTWMLLDYCIIEVVFFTIVYLPLKSYLQHPAIHPPPLSDEQLDKLLERCSETIEDPKSYLRKWFSNSPIEDIGIENVKELLCWAFWGTGDEKKVPKEDLNRFISHLEKQFGKEIPSGRGNAKSLRVTLDRVDIVARPLLWYMVRIVTI